MKGTGEEIWERESRQIEETIEIEGWLEMVREYGNRRE